MAQLSNDQLAFLKHHKIPLSDMFDVEGRPQKEYGPLMKTLGKKFAYGTTPCRNAGHSLRARDGHCIECWPKNISYAYRSGRPNYIYLARSKKSDLVKVGVTNSTSKRKTYLNSDGYGGATDWEIIFEKNIPAAGYVEHEVHSRLSGKKYVTTYQKQGETVSTNELFKCPVNEALRVLQKCITDFEQVPS
jgi:hypothetical protein